MQLKPLLSRLFDLASRLIRRYPGTVALFGFVSGVASFVLVERHAGLAKVIALVMLVSWLWLVLESSLRRSLQSWFGWQVPRPLLRYATQMVHQESLFFIIPFFAITTTWIRRIVIYPTESISAGWGYIYLPSRRIGNKLNPLANLCAFFRRDNPCRVMRRAILAAKWTNPVISFWIERITKQCLWVSVRRFIDALWQFVLAVPLHTRRYLAYQRWGRVRQGQHVSNCILLLRSV